MNFNFPYLNNDRIDILKFNLSTTNLEKSAGFNYGVINNLLVNAIAFLDTLSEPLIYYGEIDKRPTMIVPGENQFFVCSLNRWKNSEQNVFKIVKTIIHDHSYSFGSHIGSGYTQDGVFDAVPHGLTYTPAMLVYATSSIDPVSRAMVATGSVYRLSNGSTADQTAFALTTYQYYCDGTNINVGLIRDCILGSGAGSGSIGAASGTINFTFYLLQETAS